MSIHRPATPGGLSRINDDLNGEMIRQSVVTLSAVTTGTSVAVPDELKNQQLRIGIRHVTGVETNAIAGFDKAAMQELAAWFDSRAQSFDHTRVELAEAVLAAVGHDSTFDGNFRKPQLQAILAAAVNRDFGGGRR